MAKAKEGWREKGGKKARSRPTLVIVISRGPQKAARPRRATTTDESTGEEGCSGGGHT